MDVGLETFIVIVNEKYAVNVRAATNGGAEHKILDDVYYGIQSCQAFSLNELNTEFFKNLMARCQTISIESLREKTKDVQKVFNEIKKLEEAIRLEKEEIKIHYLNVDHYQGRINRLKEDNDIQNFII